MILGRENEAYKRMILRELYFSRQLSSVQVSKQIRKSIPLCTKILDDLIKEGLVKETGFGPSSGGRRPLTYTMNADSMYVVAVAMDQFITRIAIMDMHNNYVTDIARFDLPLAHNPSALQILTEQIVKVIEGSGVARNKIIGIGVGMPGFINPKEGINYTYFFKDRDHNENVVKYISGRLGLPVYLDNDSSLIALAESKFGAARHQKNAMVINIGWGVGLGMIVNGELFRGHNGFAGEFSHIPLFNNNKLCSCGKTGCLETETSLKEIIEKANRGLTTGRMSAIKKETLTGHFEQDWETIVSAASMGDQFAVGLLSEAAYNLGKGVAILIHIINPESVILSGRGALAGKVWLATIQQALNEHCIPRLSVNTSVSVSTLGYQAELIGSAALVMEHQSKENIKNIKREESSQG